MQPLTTLLVNKNWTYIGVDFLEEFHFLDHGFDFALKVDADQSGIVAVLAHLGEVGLQIFALLLNYFFK